MTIATVLPGDPGFSTPAGARDPLARLVERPTRGDLAGDTAYLAEVREAWRTGAKTSPNLGGADLEGDPKVVWAGTTPVGRAAVVAQADGPKEFAIGLVAGDPPVLVADRPGSISFTPAFLFGPDDRMLLALDLGVPMEWSKWVEAEDGRGERVWHDLPGGDGVGLVHLDEGDAATAEVRADGMTVVSLRASAYGTGMDMQSKPIPLRTVDWPQLPKLGVASATSPSLLDRELPDAWFVEQGYLDPGVKAVVTGFHVVADLPDGRSVTAFEMVPAMDAGSRFYAVVVDADGKPVSMTYGGRIDREAALPAKVRLPDGQGWIVAARGATLAYRADEDAEWQEMGTDAAHLPGDGQVRVTTPGKGEVITSVG
ncbi:hypothetical protein ACFQV2_30900 [Actinokineospora soli]|uniref:Uncharacterized protein n=1 Tax=Actinokineospora soli TaxID=1048753 RepID=A0ABW2TTJ2_9PSEU